MAENVIDGERFVYATFTAGTIGTADDVTLIASTPWDARVLDAFVIVSTTVALATGTIRDATGGGGTAYSSAMSMSALGRARDAITTVAPILSAGSALYLRRSDRGAAGLVMLTLVRV